MNNMNFDFYDISRQRHEELLKEAEYDRLVKEALQARDAHNPFTSVVLAQLGRKLTDLGLSLQERYGDLSDGEYRYLRQSEAGDC